MFMPLLDWLLDVIQYHFGFRWTTAMLPQHASRLEIELRLKSKNQGVFLLYKT